MEKIITIGSATQDIFLQSLDIESTPVSHDRYNTAFMLLEEGAKFEIDALHYAVGGGALNAAISLQQQNFQAQPFFKIGNDAAGEFILKNTASLLLDTRLHVTSPTAATGISFIIPTESGNKTVLSYPGANAELSSAELPLDALASTQYLYITSLNGKSAELLPQLVEHAAQSCTLIAVNPGFGQIKTHAQQLFYALASIKVFILNAKEARFFFQHLLREKHNQECIRSAPQQQSQAANTPTLWKSFLTTAEKEYTVSDYFHLLHKLGPEIVIVTNGKEGVYVSAAGKSYFHPSIPLQTQSTVGAGDAFGSTFVGTYIHTQSIEQAIVRGIVNSASVITGNDAQAGLLSLQELEHRARQIAHHKLFTLSSRDFR